MVGGFGEHLKAILMALKLVVPSICAEPFTLVEPITAPLYTSL
jgi:hypothetical protein